MLNSLLKIVLSSLAAWSLVSCESDEPKKVPQGGRPEVIYKNANLVYYGITDDIDISTLYKLSLYTDMTLDEENNPVGPGQILRFSINAALFDAGTTDFALLPGTYRSAKSSSDFTPETFNFGFMMSINLPGGMIEVPDGSFFGNIGVGETSFTPDLLSDGSFEVSRDSKGVYTISGVVVGEQCTKRKFRYVGKIDVVDRSEHTDDIPNTTLTDDLRLSGLTQARLQDKGDSFYLGDESYRTFELYLAAANVNLTPQWPEGAGDLLKMEFFVAWDVDVNDGIPAGTYNMAPQVSTGGIDRMDIIPGNMAPGYPNRFDYPSGTWYENIAGGLMVEYARIKGGSVTIARSEGGHAISFDLIDCDETTPHRVTGSYTQSAPIRVYK